MIRILLQRVLASAGYEVLLAEDGEQAWAVLQGPDPPPIALLDWMMPRLDGLEVCKRVRAASKEPYVYIILLTGKDEQADMIQGFAAGADDYLRKPFDNAELQARVRTGRRIVDLQADLIAAREALREQATIDPLTAIANRRSLLEGLGRELERAQRSGKPCAVLFADLDHFKRVNDEHGHAAGDAVLMHAASTMKAILRPYDLFGRYGGEEFVVVLPGCDAAGARATAERLRESIASMATLVGQATISITCSIGVAIGGVSKTGTRDDLVAAADAALYQAKGAGRNRVAVSGEDDAAPSRRVPSKDKPDAPPAVRRPVRRAR